MNTPYTSILSNDLPNPSASTVWGRYHVSPLVRPTHDGRFTSGVSIRSGRGSATTDRVMRFSGQFASASDACHHAHVQAAEWLAEQARGLAS